MHSKDARRILAFPRLRDHIACHQRKHDKFDEADKFNCPGSLIGRRQQQRERGA